MPTSRLSRYHARTRRAAMVAVGEVPSTAGSSRARPIRWPPELVGGAVRVPSSWRTQTAWSARTNPTASTRCTAALAHRPVATSNGRPHAHPNGVHDATVAERVASKVDRSAAREPVVSRRFSPSGTRVTSATTNAPATRPPRLVMTRARALVTARDRSTAVSTPSTAATRAATTAAGRVAQAPACARASPQSMTAGMPVSAAASRPRASSDARRGRTEKRAGSRVESTPVAMRLSTAHMSVTTVNSGTVSATMRSGRPARSSSPGPSTPSTASAPSPPRTDETRWSALRVIAVRHIARRRRTMRRVTASARRSRPAPEPRPARSVQPRQPVAPHV